MINPDRREYAGREITAAVLSRSVVEAAAQRIKRKGRKI